MSLWDLIQDALYTSPHYGVTATLTPVAGSPVEVTVIDRTRGERIQSGDGEVDTIVPAALVRVSELTGHGLTRDDLRRAAIAFNGLTWRVESTRPRPAPTGEADGQLLLILIET